MDHWTVLSPDGRVLAVEEGQRRSKRGKDYVRGRSGCVEPAHRPGGEFTPHFGRGRTWRLHHLTGHYPILQRTFLASMVLPLTIKSLNSCRTTSMSVLFCTHSLRIWLAKPDKVIHVTPVKWTSLTATAHSDDWVHVSSGKKREVVVERPDPAAPGVLDNRKNGDWLRNRTAQPIVQDRPDGFEARGQHQLAQPASKRNVDHMWRA